MAASWVTPVSTNPPIVAVSISPKRKTFEMVLKSGEFALNILDYRYVRQAFKAGQMSGRDVEDKFKEVELTPVDGLKINAPVIKEAEAVLECEVWRVVETGDHSLFLGRVLEAYSTEKFKRGAWNLEKYNPMLHVGGDRFTTVGKQLESEI